MDFQPKEKLEDIEIINSLKNVTRDGYFSQIMVVLTTGPFLISFALILNANLFIIGLIAAIPSLLRLLQIPSIYLVERIQNRKRITLIFLIVYRSFIFITALIPIFFSINIGLMFLLIFLVLQSASASIGHTAWNSWMHDLIPYQKLGIFYSKRIFLSTIMGIISSLSASFFLNIWNSFQFNDEIYAYSVLFILGYIFGMISIFFISKISEPSMITVKSDLKFFQKLKEPFKDVNYRRLLRFLFLWNFSINLTTPFFAVYMLEKLELDLILVVILMNISQIINLLFLRVWGYLSDKFSNKSVLGISCPLFLFCIVLWVFTSLPSIYLLTFPLLITIHILMGISMAGITLSTGNVTLKLTPRGKANWYLAITAVINSIALGIAPLIGGAFSDIFENSELSWTFIWTSPNGSSQFQVLNLQGLDFFFIIAFFIGFLSLYQLVLVKEEGEVKNKILIYEFFFELKRIMKNVFHLGSYQKILLNPFNRINNHSKKNSKNFKNEE